jgi:tetratricopeptide (TPR) repeat protein
MEANFHRFSDQNWYKCIECLEDALTIKLNMANDQSTLYIKILHLLGVVYFTQNDNKKAYRYFMEAISCRVPESEEYQKAKSYRRLGIIESRFFNHDKALTYLLKSMDIYKKYNLHLLYANVLDSIGMLFMETGKYNDAFESYSEALKIAQEHNFKDIIADAMNNIGYYYYKNKEFKKAEEYFITSIEYREQTQNFLKLAYTKANMGLLYTEMEQYEKADEYLFVAISLAMFNKNTKFFIDVYCDIAELYMRQKDYKNTMKYLHKATKLSKNIDDGRTRLRIYDLYIRFHEVRQQYKKALHYCKLFNKLEHEVHKTHTQTNLEILNIKNKIDRMIEEYERKIEQGKLEAIRAMVVTTNHELNQPLTVLQFSLEMLKRKDLGVEFSKQQLEYLEFMQDSVSRISDIVAKYNAQGQMEVDAYLDNINMIKFEE